MTETKTIWYLHVNGIHHDRYDDLEECITWATTYVREGSEIHIQTHEQWLAVADAHEEALEQAYQLGRSYED